MQKKMVRVLLSTGQMRYWGGSEVIVFELAEEFLRRGCSVTLYLDDFHPDFVDPLIRLGVQLETDPGAIILESFDLFYCQHSMINHFLGHLLETPRSKLPLLIFAHLSPYEPLELPGPAIEPCYASLVLCNSIETMKKVAEVGIEERLLRLFPNPAPNNFVAPAKPETSLKRILAVSNHFPGEALEALESLKSQGVEVTLRGAGLTSARVSPQDVQVHDAIFTIGKTVQYALASQRPVYVYDRFGGPGWLNSDNFERAAEFNFSGRCCLTKKSSVEISHELSEGFASAWRSVRTLSPNLSNYLLSEHVEDFLAMAADHKAVGVPMENDLLAADVSACWREYHMFSSLRRARIGESNHIVELGTLRQAEINAKVELNRLREALQATEVDLESLKIELGSLREIDLALVKHFSNNKVAWLILWISARLGDKQQRGILRNLYRRSRLAK